MPTAHGTVGFVTCVELGRSCIDAIYEAGGAIDFAITLPDDRARAKAGRVYLDDMCAARGIELFKVRNINDDACVDFLRQRNVDLLFIIGWSQIAKESLLASVRRGVGIHPTLLPEGRGRAAIPWAIIKGLRETGITMFLLDDGVDTGPILAQQRIAIGPRETATSLYARVAAAHADLVRRQWAALATDALPGQPQDRTAGSYWPGRTPADGELSKQMSVDDADRLVRATTRPYPGAFIRESDTSIIRVWAGAPAGAAAPPAGARRLSFRDGDYDALDWDVEIVPAGLTPA
jgi:methionyl-tRNA formyltransferase